MSDDDALLLFWAGDTCSYIELSPGTSRDSDAVAYNSVVTYRCDPGYVFQDNTTVRTLICLLTNGTLAWNCNGSQPICQG